MPRKKSSFSFSADEIIATLKHSSLPTVLVEGGDDIIVYRRLEMRFGPGIISVMPAGGRPNVLSVFARRAELGSDFKIVFVVDKDAWIITGVPVLDEEQLVMTDGYSIENDIYRDGDLETFMLAAEQGDFRRELEAFVSWFALIFSRNGKFSLHPDAVFVGGLIPAAVTALSPGENYPDQLRENIATNYQRLLRGKSLFALLLRQLSRSGRHPRHNSESLLEYVAREPGPLVSDLFNRVHQKLALDQ